MKLKILLLIVLLNTSCATRGPFVRNLSKTDKNEIKYEECYLFINGFWGTSETQNCSHKEITL